LVSKYKILYFHWYQKSCAILKFYLFTNGISKFVWLLWIIIKFCVKNVWYVLPKCKGSLTSLLYIDSCWVYLILRSLTSLLYVIHVYKGSFTSTLMHCILYFMWVRVLSSLLHVMHVCRGANFTSLSSWMHIAYISLLFDLFSPLYWWFDKKGEKYLMNLYMHVCFIPLFYTKRGRMILRVYAYMFCLMIWQKGGEVFELYACLSPYFMHICLFSLCTSLYILLFIVMDELRGSFYEA